MSFTPPKVPDESDLTPEQREEIERNWDEMCAAIQADEDAAAAQGRDYWADQFAAQVRATLPPTVDVPGDDDILLSVVRLKAIAAGLYINQRIMVALLMIEREALVTCGARQPLSRRESDALRQRWHEQLTHCEQP